MKKHLVVLSLVAMLGVAGSGCAKEEKKAVPAQHDMKGMTQNQQVKTEDLPTLTADFKVQGNQVTIHWDTNLKISAEHYGGENVKGEGHAHLYVDGAKVAGLKTKDDYVLQNLAPGKHLVEIALQQNNHASYNVSKSLEVEIPQPAAKE